MPDSLNCNAASWLCGCSLAAARQPVRQAVDVLGRTRDARAWAKLLLCILAGSLRLGPVAPPQDERPRLLAARQHMRCLYRRQICLDLQSCSLSSLDRQQLPHLLQSARIVERRQIARIAPFGHGLQRAAQELAAAGLGQQVDEEDA